MRTARGHPQDREARAPASRPRVMRGLLRVGTDHSLLSPRAEPVRLTFVAVLVPMAHLLLSSISEPRYWRRSRRGLVSERKRRFATERRTVDAHCTRMLLE
jgi:hypothetical protein